MAACRLGGAWPRAMNIFEVALNDGLVPEPKKLGKKSPRDKRDRLVVSNIFQYFLFSSLPGEMIQFDKYFSNGLKPSNKWEKRRV